MAKKLIFISNLIINKNKDFSLLIKPGFKKSKIE